MTTRPNFLARSFFIILAIIIMLPIANATNRPTPVPLYGPYDSFLDRSKQTFNGHPSKAIGRPWRQVENFVTICDASGCIARVPSKHGQEQSNKYSIPKVFVYHWVNNRWEINSTQFIYCNDNSTVFSTFSEFLKPNADGSFSGERTIKVTGSGCPDEGPGVYRLPVKLTPSK